MSIPAAPRATISILASDSAQGSQFSALLPLFGSVEQVTVDDYDRLTVHGSRLNRTMDGAASDWIFLLEDREVISDQLAREILEVVSGSPSAWGFRVQKIATYEGSPLNLTAADAGDVRLFHRRHARFESTSLPAALKVQGTVVRLGGQLLLPTFESRGAHEQFLAAHGKPRRFPARLAFFLLSALRTGGLWKGRCSRRYLWTEAGWALTELKIENGKLKK